MIKAVVPVHIGSLGIKMVKIKFFDSYGVQPPIEVINYLGKPIRYNTDQVQPVGQVFCGHLCLYVLKELNIGNSFRIF